MPAMSDLLSFQPPARRHVALTYHALTRWFETRFSGLEHLGANRPALYVGNHTLLGYDVPPDAQLAEQSCTLWQPYHLATDPR